jgi:hypothetical protein
MPQTGYGFMPDFGQLMQIGANFGQGYQNRRVANAMAGFDGNYEEAANKLMQMGRIDEAVKLYSAAALGDYRTVMGAAATQKTEPSVKEQLLRQYMPQQGPSYLSPPDTESAADAAEEAEASGVPGTSYTRPSLDGAPAMVQKELMSIEGQAAAKAKGKGSGDRESFRTGLKEAAPAVNELISGLVSQVREADEGTFANALGPLQGVAPPEDWRGTITSGIPQTLGSIANYFEKGAEEGFTTGEGADWRLKEPGELGGGFTDTLRTQVQSTQASLIGVMQRLLRIPGIGAQSDYELRQIIAQAGELSKARTKADFKDRLSTVLTNLKSIGIPLDLPSLDQVAGPSNNKTADRYTNPAEADQASAGGGVNENTMVGGENIGRTTNQPPTPPKRALNALRAYKNNPQARAAFDEIYGPGAAEFYLQKYR